MKDARLAAMIPGSSFPGAGKAEAERDPRVQRALVLARSLQELASRLQTPQERRQQAELDRMLQSPQDKATLVQITDQAFRSNSAPRSVDQFTHILDVQGVPRFFSPIERTLLKGFQSFGSYLPDVAVPLVKERMQKETANVILPAEEELLADFLRKRREQGLRMNVNFLGEAILSEREAQRRLEQYLEAIQWGETEVFSVKISTLFSQISPLPRDHTIAVLCQRLEVLYRSAERAVFLRADGKRVPKFIYLDMEEYRDMSLTAEVFMQTLQRPGLEGTEAGIVLQAYIPDSYQTQRTLNAWARERVRKGGAPITLRVVKGANMEMERFEASLKGWPAAPFQKKIETDANYKRMLLEGMSDENLAAVRLGIASHNLFDLAYGLALAEEKKAGESVQFEMLEGMANHQRRALAQETGNLLLYAPVCHKKDFTHAIGYLIRRLDENTGEENFLRHAFKLSVGSGEWEKLEKSFLRSIELMSSLDDGPRRTQDRNKDSPLPGISDVPLIQPQPGFSQVRFATGQFMNEPDTDWSLRQNGKWAENVLAEWEGIKENRGVDIPLVIGGEERFEGRPIHQCLDPSRPGMSVGRYREASASDIDGAVSCACQDEEGWGKISVQERGRQLRLVAAEIRRSRGRLMGAALANAGKTLVESDPEVSEAVDFVEFYARSAEAFSELDGVASGPRGVVAVVPPWNFPIAIPCGGIAAGLATGNRVVIKPASPAVLVAYEMCECFWRAGISKKVLQFVPCAGREGGRRLVTHPGVNTVILTGGTETAMEMLREKPGLHLSAETGGKNATIVTALSDRDLAVKNVLHSAFSHSGQKCSATSLLLLEAEIYDDPEFKRMLCEAAESLSVGSAWDLKTRLGPLIRPPVGDLDNALKTLEQGESWALMPSQVEGNRNLWRPGIKWGVQRGSYTHLTEFFGPVLGVMRFQSLSEAITMVNQSGYGLTSGLESLDDREHEQWKKGIRAGNLYINRTTTGAIVLRQPFGGMGKSAFGPGLKAGGPNYLAQFLKFSERPGPPRGGEIADPFLRELQRALEGDRGQRGDDVEKVLRAISSYDHFYRMEFGLSHDPFRIVGQDNIRRYIPIGDLRIRIAEDDTLFEIFARVCAARVTCNRITVSATPGLRLAALDILHDLTESWAASIEFVEETDADLIDVIDLGQTDRLRYAGSKAPDAVRLAAMRHAVGLIEAPVLMSGRIELLWYVKEQSISFDYHRYGNLGNRGHEPRAPIR